MKRVFFLMGLVGFLAAGLCLLDDGKAGAAGEAGAGSLPVSPELQAEDGVMAGEGMTADIKTLRRLMDAAREQLQGDGMPQGRALGDHPPARSGQASRADAPAGGGVQAPGSAEKSVGGFLAADPEDDLEFVWGLVVEEFDYIWPSVDPLNAATIDTNALGAFNLPTAASGIPDVVEFLLVQEVLGLQTPYAYCGSDLTAPERWDAIEAAWSFDADTAMIADLGLTSAQQDTVKRVITAYCMVGDFSSAYLGMLLGGLTGFYAENGAAEEALFQIHSCPWPLSFIGDLDGDGFNNLLEWQNVLLETTYLANAANPASYPIGTFYTMTRTQEGRGLSPYPVAQKYAANDVVTLKAFPVEPWTFSHWEITWPANPETPVISQDNPVTVTMTSDVAVHMVYERDPEAGVLQYFDDSELAAALRATGLPQTQAGEILWEDALTLTSLDASGREITDLDGIELLEGLTHLDLYDNQLTEVYDLASLTSLVHLDLGHNLIEDISPLAGLLNLEWLELGRGDPFERDFTVFPETGNDIEDISPLASLTGLTYLGLTGNDICDLSSLAGLTGLNYLLLNGNPLEVAALLPIKSLPSLVMLGLGDMGFDDDDMTEALHCENNEVQETCWSYLWIVDVSQNELTSLDCLEGYGDLVTLLAHMNPELSDISALEDLGELRLLLAARCSIEDITPLSSLSDLQALYLSENSILDITALQGLGQLVDLSLDENDISDLAPLVANIGIGQGDVVSLYGNALSDFAYCGQIPAMQARGAEVLFDESDEPPCVFRLSDPVLRAAVCEALTVGGVNPCSDGVLSPEEASMLTRLEYDGSGAAPEARISSLEGLERFTNLTHLSLPGNNIDDDDMEPLSSLTRLEHLDLYGNQLTEVTALAPLTSLVYLDLGHNLIEDISPLASLVNLTWLELGRGDFERDFLSFPETGNEITNVSPLAGLTALTYLGLTGNDISNLSPLDDLINLEGLLLSGNPLVNATALLPITGLSALTTLGLGDLGFTDSVMTDALFGDDNGVPTDPYWPSLEILDVSENQLTSLSCLEGYENLVALLAHMNGTLSDISALEGLVNLAILVAAECNIEDEDIIALQGLVNLQIVYLSDNNVDDISELQWLAQLQSLYLSPDIPGLLHLSIDGNGISDITALQGFSQLQSLDLSDNEISDITDLEGLAQLQKLNLDDNSVSDLASLVANGGIGTGDTVSLCGNELPCPVYLSQIPALKARGVTVLYDPSPTLCDPVLRAAVCEALTVGGVNPCSDGVLSPEEASALTELVYDGSGEDPEARISSLDGLEMCTNLTHLSLPGNNISDDDMITLGSLTGLEHLDLSNNQLTDVTALSALTSLKYLNLSHNMIGDISSLVSLASLQYLNLSDNHVTDIETLQWLTALCMLDISNNQHCRYKDPNCNPAEEYCERVCYEEGCEMNLAYLVNNPGLGIGDIVDIRGNPYLYVGVPECVDSALLDFRCIKPECAHFGCVNIRDCVYPACITPELLQAQAVADFPQAQVGALEGRGVTVLHLIPSLPPEPAPYPVERSPEVLAYHTGIGAEPAPWVTTEQFSQFDLLLGDPYLFDTFPNTFGNGSERAEVLRLVGQVGAPGLRDLNPNIIVLPRDSWIMERDRVVNRPYVDYYMHDPRGQLIYASWDANYVAPYINPYVNCCDESTEEDSYGWRLATLFAGEIGPMFGYGEKPMGDGAYYDLVFGSMGALGDANRDGNITMEDSEQYTVGTTAMLDRMRFLCGDDAVLMGNAFGSWAANHPYYDHFNGIYDERGMGGHYHKNIAGEWVLDEVEESRNWHDVWKGYSVNDQAPGDNYHIILTAPSKGIPGVRETDADPGRTIQFHEEDYRRMRLLLGTVLLRDSGYLFFANGIGRMPIWADEFNMDLGAAQSAHERRSIPGGEYYYVRKYQYGAVVVNPTPHDLVYNTFSDDLDCDGLGGQGGNVFIDLTPCRSADVYYALGWGKNYAGRRFLIPAFDARILQDSGSANPVPGTLISGYPVCGQAPASLTGNPVSFVTGTEEALLGLGSSYAMDITTGNDYVNDLNVYLDLTYEPLGDMEVRLIHKATGYPDAAVTLMKQVGNMSQDMHKTLFDDEPEPPNDEPVPIWSWQTGVPSYSNARFSPQMPLAAFDGRPVQGTWRLEVLSDGVGYGILHKMRLDFNGWISGNPAVPTKNESQSPPSVSGITLGDSVTSIKSIILQAQADRVGDMAAAIMSPSGKVVPLFFHVGGNSDVIQLTFDDQECSQNCPPLVSAIPPSAFYGNPVLCRTTLCERTYVDDQLIEEPLSLARFMDENPGEWKLYLYSNYTKVSQWINNGAPTPVHEYVPRDPNGDSVLDFTHRWGITYEAEGVEEERTVFTSDPDWVTPTPPPTPGTADPLSVPPHIGDQMTIGVLEPASNEGEGEGEGEADVPDVCVELTISPTTAGTPLDLSLLSVVLEYDPPDEEPVSVPLFQEYEASGAVTTGTHVYFQDGVPATIACGVAPYEGLYRPSGRSSLSQFTGKTGGGVWRLYVTNHSDVTLTVNWAISNWLTPLAQVEPPLGECADRALTAIAAYAMTESAWGVIWVDIPTIYSGVVGGRLEVNWPGGQGGVIKISDSGPPAEDLYTASVDADKEYQTWDLSMDDLESIFGDALEAGDPSTLVFSVRKPGEGEGEGEGDEYSEAVLTWRINPYDWSNPVEGRFQSGKLLGYYLKSASGPVAVGDDLVTADIYAYGYHKTPDCFTYDLLLYTNSNGGVPAGTIALEHEGVELTSPMLTPTNPMLHRIEAATPGDCDGECMLRYLWEFCPDSEGEGETELCYGSNCGRLFPMRLMPPVCATVPNVVGLQQAAAAAALTGAGLTVGTVTESFSDTVPVGEVMSQTPLGGASVAPGTAVDIEVSKGPEPVTVPNVVGLQQAAAETALTGAGLAVGTVTESFSDTVPVGEVMSQTPAAAASAAPESAVDLEVSKGPEI